MWESNIYNDDGSDKDDEQESSNRGKRPVPVEAEEPKERLLRRVGEAKPPQRGDVPQGMARCPVCAALVPNSRLKEHQEKYHLEQDQPDVEQCPVCKAIVRGDRMEKHLRKVHPDYPS